MAVKVAVYLVVKRTGQSEEDGAPSVIIFDAKLTHYEASKVAEKNPGSEVMKLTAKK